MNKDKDIEGGWIARIKQTHYDNNTKKISVSHSNGLYKVVRISETELLVEQNNFTEKKITNWIFFEDSDTNTYVSFSDGMLNKLFLKSGKLIHSWSQQTNKNDIMTNGYVELERACVKCR